MHDGKGIRFTANEDVLPDKGMFKTNVVTITTLASCKLALLFEVVSPVLRSLFQRLSLVGPCRTQLL